MNNQIKGDNINMNNDLNYKIKFDQVLNDNKENFVNRLVELLKINSIYDEKTQSEDAPFGKGILACLEHFLSMAKNDGFETLQDGGYAGLVEYGGSGKKVGILCHLDVVPVGDDWSSDPFNPVIKDGKIIARGAMDDKGPTMAAYLALKMIKDAGIKLRNKIQIILGTDEETGWRGIEHYFSKYPMPEIGFAPDADFPLIYGEKGMIHGFIKGNGFKDEDVIYVRGGSRFNIVIDKAEGMTKSSHESAFKNYLEENHLTGNFEKRENGYYYQIIGTAAHAMEPSKGINAGTHLAKFLSKYTSNKLIHFIANNLHNDFDLKGLGLSFHTTEMGSLTCNMGILDISDKGSVGLDLRYPIGFSFDHFVDVMKDATRKDSLSLDGFTNKVPHYVDPSDPLVEGLYQIYVKHTNDVINKPITIGGGTYARALKKAVAFGMEMPGDETVAHQKDEFLKIDAYFQAILIYVDAILYLGEIDA